MLESIGKPQEESAPATIEISPIHQAALKFDDSEWNILSKGYLPSNTTIKRDHAVAYLGPGASEEEIHNEYRKMLSLNSQLVNFGNRVVRRLMLDNFF